MFRFNEYLPPKKNLFVAFTNMNHIIGNQQIIISISILKLWSSTQRSVGWLGNKNCYYTPSSTWPSCHRQSIFFSLAMINGKIYWVLGLIFTSTSWSEITKKNQQKSLKANNCRKEMSKKTLNNINWICYVNRIVEFYYLL